MSKPSQLDLTPALQGVVSSALVLGACIGALGCGSLADRFGRKKTLRWIAALFTISTIFCAVSMNFIFMAIFIVMGQLTAFCVNAILGNIWGNWGPIWRVMIISASIPAIFLWFNSFHISGSPRWLLLQNKVRRARHLFSRPGFPREVSEKLANNAKNTEDTGNGLAWRSILKNPVLFICSSLVSSLP